MRKIAAKPSVLVFLKKFKTEVKKMKTINLRDYYPFYQSDFYVEIADEIVALLIQFKKEDHANHERVRVWRAYYSMDADHSLEREVAMAALSPEELYEQKVSNKELYSAIRSLSEKQAKRICAYYFLGMSKAAIAKAEGVSKATVGESIGLGLVKIKKLFKNYF